MIPFKEITTTFSILSLKKYMHHAELVHLFIFPKGTYALVIWFQNCHILKN